MHLVRIMRASLPVHQHVRGQWFAKLIRMKTMLDKVKIKRNWWMAALYFWPPTKLHIWLHARSCFYKRHRYIRTTCKINSWLGLDWSINKAWCWIPSSFAFLWWLLCLSIILRSDLINVAVFLSKLCILLSSLGFIQLLLSPLALGSLRCVHVWLVGTLVEVSLHWFWLMIVHDIKLRDCLSQRAILLHFRSRLGGC